jgi:hypothetical protein
LFARYKVSIEGVGTTGDEEVPSLGSEFDAIIVD